MFCVIFIQHVANLHLYPLYMEFSRQKQLLQIFSIKLAIYCQRSLLMRAYISNNVMQLTFVGRIFFFPLFVTIGTNTTCYLFFAIKCIYKTWPLFLRILISGWIAQITKFPNGKTSEILCLFYYLYDRTEMSLNMRYVDSSQRLFNDLFNFVSKFYFFFCSFYRTINFLFKR